MTTPRSGTDAPLTDRLDDAVRDAAVVRAGRGGGATLARWSRGSRLVGWFRAEPEPRLLVLDLRQARLVGPTVRLAAWAGATSAGAARWTGGDRVGRALRDRVRASPLRVAGAVGIVLSLVGLAVGLRGGGPAGGWLVLLGVALLVTREGRSTEELAATRPVRALADAFAPPAAPERDGSPQVDEPADEPATDDRAPVPEQDRDR